MKTSTRLFESEVALIIRDNAEDVAKDIAGLTSILGYDLKPGPTRNILDVYYDTPDVSLMGKRITLRTRKIDGALLLSMKSNPRPIIRRGTRRRESELPWSHSSFQRLSRELGLKEPTFSRTEFKFLSPSRALASLGLIPVQKRRTKRETRIIGENGKKSTSVIAELAIDDVTYYFQSRRVRLLEIEIEAKASGALRKISQIADALEDLYPDSLREWAHSKFVTGMAIQRLLEKDRLPGPQDNALLSNDAFLALDQQLSRSRP